MPISARALKLLCYIPEAFVVGLACLTFVGIRPAMKKTALFAVIYGCSIFFCRDLILPWFGLPLGIHTCILFAINVFFLWIFFGLYLSGALICAFLYFLILIVTEPLVSISFKLIGVSIAEVLASWWMSILFNCFTLCLVLGIVYILRKTNFTFLPIAQIIRDDKND